MKHQTETISHNLRCYRESRGLSFDQLSALTGVSKSMLRQIETGKSSPTIATIWKIANGLRLSFSSLLCQQTIEAEVKSVKAEKPLIAEDGHFRLFPLIPFEPQQSFETYYFEIDPQTVFHGDPHAGNVYEYLFVQSGKICISTKGNDYEVCKGEFLRFLADSDHDYKCVGEKMATAILQLSYHI